MSKGDRMHLKLVKSNDDLPVISSNLPKLSFEQIKFDFIKNIIKNELDVSLFKNIVSHFFEEIECPADLKTELKSFNAVACYLLGQREEILKDDFIKLISDTSNKYYSKIMMQNYKQYERYSTENLSIKFATFIFEAVKLDSYSLEEAIDHLFILEKNIFDYEWNDLIMDKCISNR